MGKLINNEEDKPKDSHFSHEHPLELTSLGQMGNTICSGCKIEIVAGRDYYTCKVCTYSLHCTCYNMPRFIRHPADPSHDLSLLLVPSFECKACGLQGSGFSYNCSICLVHYHSLCLQMPLTKTHSSHPHTLKLEFSPPYGTSKGFRCDVCGKTGSDHWLYRCGGCEFDVHPTCVTSTPRPSSQPQNPSNTTFQAPTLPTNSINVAGSSSSAPPLNPSANYDNPKPAMHPHGHYLNQSQPQNQSTTACGAPTMPTNNTNIMGSSTGALPSNPSTNYVNPNPAMRPNGNYVNQMGSYGYNQGALVQAGGTGGTQGIGYPYQPGLNNNAQGILGAGMMGLVVTGVVTGIGEGMGQAIVGGFIGNDGSGLSDQ